MYINIESFSYLACAVAFSILSALIAVGESGGKHRKALLAATIGTAIWAGAAALAPWIGVNGAAFSVLELFRTLSWLFVAYSLLESRMEANASRPYKLLVFGFSAISIAITGLSVFAFYAPISGTLAALGQTALGGARVSLAVAGLILVENTFRNANAEKRWALKYICFGMAVIFGYDFLLHADSALFQHIDPALFGARGFINALAAPLLAVGMSRHASWDVDIHVSRRVVFHSAALLGSGLYLLGIAGAGFYLKQFGGDWGQILQIVFLFGSIIAFTALMGSASARARAKVWISKHFFSYKYDYREEWLRFIQTIASEERQSSLHLRIVQATAAIVDCSAGALWVLRAEDKAYLPTANWNMGDRLPAEPSNSPFISHLNQSHQVIDLNAAKTDENPQEDLAIPVWLLENTRAWLITPIVDKGNLSAFLVLGNARIRQDLTWEDIDLLKTVGQQAASYLAEEKAMNELTDTRRLKDFNQRFAFVVHDIKNLVSQMSLLLQNAEKHGSNPEFQKDMLATVRNSVTQLNQLLTKFKASGDESDTEKSALTDILSSTAKTWIQQKPDLEVSFQNTPSDFFIDEEKLESILNHLLQNAIEAIDINGKVSFRQSLEGNMLVLEIEDNGPGMDAAYIQDHLFRPLDTKKSGGYGLGAYQTRELVRQLGGRLEVESKLGHGTVMRVLLPRDDNRGKISTKIQRTETE